MFDKEEIFQRYPELIACKADMEKALEALIATARQGGQVLVCGNGGSCADSDHIVGELMKGFLKKRPLSDADLELWKAQYGEEGGSQAEGLQQGIRAVSLPAQSAVLSAFANDCDPESAYAQLAWNYAQKDDFFIGISTSGNAKNVNAAALSHQMNQASALSVADRILRCVHLKANGKTER